VGGVQGGGGSNPFGGGNQGVAGEQAHGGTAGSEAQEGGGGTLPFTGYPMTPLIWIVLVLVTVGLCVRIAWSVRQRLGSSESRTPGP
jgi:hypothetical protein